jgi:threonine/homoserine/homoserine lactone efflux protein
MDVIAWGLFLPACFAINMAPGPNNLVSVSNAARFGVGRSLLAGSGRLAAFGIMIALVAIGLGAILASSETAFLAIKWLGAVYLVYIGIKLIRSPIDPAAPGNGDCPSLRELIRQEFFLAIGNPKASATFTAFFPQFIDSSEASAPQLFWMGTVFLALECVAIAAYAMIGLLAGGALRSGRRLALLNKGVGAFFVVSGLSIALTSR